MGLDITVYKLTKKRQEEYFTLTNVHQQYDEDVKSFPEWTKSIENTKDLEYYDWEKYQKETGLDINSCDFLYKIYDDTGAYMGVEDSNGVEHKINLDKVPIIIVPTKILYHKEIGYQRKGFNGKFYADYESGKIGYYVWTKEELERYKRDYAEEPDKFQENIIDNFIEGECVVTFSW